MSNEFKLVPVEPDESMTRAALLAFNSPSGNIFQALKDAIAAAPQPPALGGEPEVLAWRLNGYNFNSYRFAADYASYTKREDEIAYLIDRAHLAQLKAEIARWKACYEEASDKHSAAYAESNALADQVDNLKAELAGSDKDSREQIDQVKKAYEFLMLCRQDKTDTAIDAGAMRDANEWLTVAAENLGAALCKPAGGEKV